MGKKKRTNTKQTRRSTPKAPRPKKPMPKWVKWAWGILGGMVLLGALFGGEEGATTPTEPPAQIMQSQKLVAEPVEIEEPPAQTAQPAAAEAEATELEAAEPEPLPEPEPEEADPEQVPVADQLLALTAAPEKTDFTSTSVEGDRHYYKWQRPELGEAVSSVWRGPEDWWVKIARPAFAAGDLGELEKIDERFQRITTGPLAGLIVIDSGVVMHLRTPAYHRTQQEEEARYEAERAATEPEPAPAPTPANVYYKNCTAARNAGAAPLHRGEPGYRSAMDRDGDGIACDK